MARGLTVVYIATRRFFSNKFALTPSFESKCIYDGCQSEAQLSKPQLVLTSTRARL